MAAPAHIARENGKKGGRPKGATQLRLREYFTDDDIAYTVELIKERMKTSDRILVEVGQQLFGKPQQNVDLTSGGEALRLSFDPTFNAPPRQAEEDSQ